MFSSDPISDMLTQIRNSISVGAKNVTVKFSKVKMQILKILKDKEYISDYATDNEKNPKTITIQINYKNKKPTINRISRISKPGRRIYVKYKEIPRPIGGLGLIIISTSKGIMTGNQARKEGLGGELICQVF